MTASAATPSTIPGPQVAITMPQMAPVISKKAQLIAHVMAFNPFKPLSGRVTQTPSDLLMLSGIITAVSFAVASFFTGATLYSCGFAFLGLVALFGAYCVRKYPTLIQLQGMVTSLENTNRDLQTTNRDLQETRQQMEQIASNLSHENTRLQDTSRNLAQTNTDLRTTNDRLSETQRNLAQTNTDLRATNANLEAINTNLTAQVGQLTGQVTQLEQILQRIVTNVDQFSQHNLSFVTSLQRLEGRNAALDSSIQTLEMRFDGNFSNLLEATRTLEAQIAANRAFTQEVNTRLADVLNDANFRDRLAALPIVNEQIIRAQGQLAETTARLTALETRCGETQAAINRGIAELSAVNTQIQESRGQLTAATRRLETVESRITAQVGRMDNAINRLDSAVPGAEPAVGTPTGAPNIMRTGGVVTQDAALRAALPTLVDVNMG